jgi:hypothetical protein
MTTPLLLLLLAASAAFSAEVAPTVIAGLPEVPPLYAAPAAAWLQPLKDQTLSPLETTLNRLAAARLEIPTIPEGLEPRIRDLHLQRLAPLIEHAARLHTPPLTAAEFAALKPGEQDATLELAAIEAKKEVVQKAYEIAGQAAPLLARASYDKKTRDELYTVAAQLGEISRHYLWAIPAKTSERDFFIQAEVQTRAHFHAVQEALSSGKTISVAAALAAGGSPGKTPAKTPVAADAPASAKRVGTPYANKLLANFRATKSGWGQKDLAALYKGFDFIGEGGGPHDKYHHPKYPELFATVSRQNSLPPGYAQTAVKLIDRLFELELGAPALPESAVSREEVPPLPTPAPQTPKDKTPQLVASVDAPLSKGGATPAERPSARRRRERERPAEAKTPPAADSSPSLPALLPAQLGGDPQKKPEPLSPPLDPPKPVDKTWLDWLKKILP